MTTSRERSTASWLLRSAVMLNAKSWYSVVTRMLGGLFKDTDLYCSRIDHRQIDAALPGRGNRFCITRICVSHDTGARICSQNPLEPLVGRAGALRNANHAGVE